MPRFLFLLTLLLGSALTSAQEEKEPEKWKLSQSVSFPEGTVVKYSETTELGGPTEINRPHSSRQTRLETQFEHRSTLEVRFLPEDLASLEVLRLTDKETSTDEDGSTQIRNQRSPLEHIVFKGERGLNAGKFRWKFPDGYTPMKEEKKARKAFLTPFLKNGGPFFGAKKEGRALGEEWNIDPYQLQKYLGLDPRGIFHWESGKVTVKFAEIIEHQGMPCARITFEAKKITSTHKKKGRIHLNCRGELLRSIDHHCDVQFHLDGDYQIESGVSGLELKSTGKMKIRAGAEVTLPKVTDGLR